MRTGMAQVCDLETVLLGNSAVMRELRKRVQLAAHSAYPTLVVGESGTGKELVAWFLHRLNGRANEPFVALNASAIPHELAESYLFGHRKGSFTGACEDRPGAFVEAHGGTLFLDEVEAMPLGLQAKLLRILEDGEVQKVGESRTMKVNVRLVAATNINLEAAVEAGKFRRDLYHRLAVLTVATPPLREHPEDIELLVGHFLNLAEGIRRSLTGGALRMLERYTWPGNVRELRNAVAHATVFTDIPCLDEDSFAFLQGGKQEEFRLPLALTSVLGGSTFPTFVEWKNLYFQLLKSRYPKASRVALASIAHVSSRTLYTQLPIPPPRSQK